MVAVRLALSCAGAATAALIVLGFRPATAGCAAAGNSAPAFTAVRVVVQPWKGPHQVWGEFVVPDAFAAKRRAAILNVVGTAQPVLTTLAEDIVHGRRVSAPPGHVVIHEHLETRTALRFLFTGRFGDLRSACEWRLIPRHTSSIAGTRIYFPYSTCETFFAIRADCAGGSIFAKC